MTLMNCSVLCQSTLLLRLLSTCQAMPGKHPDQKQAYQLDGPKNEQNRHAEGIQQVLQESHKLLSGMMCYCILDLSC